jgi:hypothetical protein
LGPFRKLSKFSYQYEWRLVCYDGSGDVRKINIGSIRDISVILPTDEVNKQIQIHYERTRIDPCEERTMILSEV